MYNTSNWNFSTTQRFGINGMFLLLVYYTLFSFIVLWNQVVILCATAAPKRELLHHNISQRNEYMS